MSLFGVDFRIGVPLLETAHLIHAVAAGNGRWLSVVRFLIVFLLTLASIPCGTQVRADGLPDGAYHVAKLPSRGGVFAGFSTTIGFSDFNAVGYQPVEIQFSAPVPTTADLRLTYRVSSLLSQQTPDDNGFVVDIPILVPEGTRSATWTRYFPKWMVGVGFEVLVLQDNRVLAGYKGSASRGYSRNQYFGWPAFAREELEMNWLLITADQVVRKLDRQTFPSESGFGYFANAVPLPATIRSSVMRGAVRNIPQILVCGQQNLPDDWRGYQRWDVVVMDKEAIKRLKQRDSEWKALFGWVLCGGTIVVWDADSQAELDSLFDRRSDVTDTAASEPYTKGFYEKMGLADFALIEAGVLVITPAVTSSGGLVTPASTAWGKNSLLGIGLGAGKAIAVQPPVPFGLDSQKWDFFRRLLEKKTSATLGRGGDPILGNNDFQRWLVPGVSQPPVYVLISLLTVFVILVGPIAYRQTAKQGRSHLMFVIAPVLALLTTVIMFGYGIAADGFSSIVRIRQLTWVDGASGEAGERVRATYFAPLRPRDGLTFSGDAEVIGLRRPDGKSWEQRQSRGGESRGTVTITEDSQRFSSDFLPSREQRQFLTHQPRYGIGRLRLQPTATGANSSCQVFNEFDFQLNDVLVRDKQGRYWQVKNLAPGGVALGTAVDASFASALLGKYYLDHRRVASRGTAPISSSSWRGEVYDLMLELQRIIADPGQSGDGTFESWLQLHLQTRGEIPKGYFVAISDVSEELCAVEESFVQDSVHYVFGTLP